MRDVWRSIVLTTGARAYGLVLSVILLVLMARWLGPDGRGVVSSAVAWYSLLVTIGSLSLGQVVMHIAARASNRAWIGPAAGTLLLLGGGLTAVIWVITTVVRFMGGSGAVSKLPGVAIAAAGLLVPFLIWEQYGSALLIAIGRLSTYNVAIASGRTVALLAAIGLVGAAHFGVAGALLSMVAGQCIVAGLGMTRVVREGAPHVAPTRAMARDLLSGGVRLHLNSIGMSWVSAVTILLVLQHLGQHASGIYTTALDLMAVLLVVAQAGAMVLYAQITADGVTSSWTKQVHVLVRLTALTLVASLGAGIAAPWVVPLVLGERFAEVVPVWRVLLLGVAPQTVTLLMAPQWVARGRFLEATIFTVGTGLIAVAWNAWLIPRSGIISAAWVTSASSVFLMLVNIAFAIQINRGIRTEHERPDS